MFSGNIKETFHELFFVIEPSSTNEVISIKVCKEIMF